MIRWCWLLAAAAAAVSSAASESDRAGTGLRARPDIITDPIEIGMVLKHGDARMRLADRCLESLFKVEGDGETAEGLRVLNLTDFDLTKVTVRQVTPERVRFGFEFTKADELKTVYWEADCPLAP